MTNLPFMTLLSFSSFEVATRTPRTTSSTCLPDCHLLYEHCSLCETISPINLSVINNSTSLAIMAQHSDEVDQLLRAVMPQAPEVLHHVFALEGKSLQSLPLQRHKPDEKPRGQRSPAGTQYSREQGGIPGPDHCHRTVQGQQSDQSKSTASFEPLPQVLLTCISEYIFWAKRPSIPHPAVT